MSLPSPSIHTTHQSCSLINHTLNMSAARPLLAALNTKTLIRSLFSLEPEPEQQSLSSYIPSPSHPPTTSILSNSPRWPFEKASWLISRAYLKSVLLVIRSKSFPYFPFHGSSLMCASPAVTSKVHVKLCSNSSFDGFFSSEPFAHT